MLLPKEFSCVQCRVFTSWQVFLHAGLQLNLLSAVSLVEAILSGAANLGFEPSLQVC